MSRILVAGPWVGEFGYELFRWQGYVRKQSEGYDQVIIASRPGHEVLYQDFCTRYIPFASDLNPCEGLANGTTTDLAQLSSSLFAGIPYVTMLCPAKKIVNEEQTFIPYGNVVTKSYTVLFHARHISVNDAKLMPTGHKYQKEIRNWAEDNWNKLMVKVSSCGYKVISIGDPTASLHISGSIDMRGISLAKLLVVVGGAHCMVGPSSGALHFATLCRCPQVVWGCHPPARGIPDLELRYKKDWNPFHTKVQFLPTDSNWNPPVDRVFRSILALH